MDAAASLTLLYLPAAIGLGALHALEPGHAKTVIAAYLIGIHGTWRDAVLLGLSAAATHSLVVIALALGALLLGERFSTQAAERVLTIGSAVLVVLIGLWLLWRRWPRRHDHGHSHDHGHGHSHEAHAHDHAHHDHHHALPAYVAQGQRPGLGQIIAFGASGGLIPCPASVTVMLLALTAGQIATGLTLVLGFSIGLAITLVAVGLAVVVGWRRVGAGRFGRLSTHAPAISATVITLSGLAALAVALR